MTDRKTPVGLGLIGLGRLGRVRAEIAARQVPGARLVSVQDIDADLTAATAHEFAATAIDSVGALVDHPGVAGVIVATPTSLHVDPVTTVAESGKPLFCEKPLASTLDDTRLLVETIDHAGVACQIGFNRRHDPDHIDARRLISEGRIGTPTYLRSNIRDPSLPNPGHSTRTPVEASSSTC